MSDENQKQPQEKDVLRPHQFDGIQEYENQLPRWWVGLFYITILFGIAYYFYYEIEDSGRTLYQEYREEHLSEISKQKMAEAEVKPLSEEELKNLSKKPEVLNAGFVQFKAKCASCHLEDGGGSVGPNLTDDYWIHGNRMTDLVNVISNGVPEKGMPVWKALMSADEIRSVASYVRSLHGSKPKTPKKPEGELTKFE